MIAINAPAAREPGVGRAEINKRGASTKPAGTRTRCASCLKSNEVSLSVIYSPIVVTQPVLLRLRKNPYSSNASSCDDDSPSGTINLFRPIRHGGQMVHCDPERSDQTGLLLECRRLQRDASDRYLRQQTTQRVERAPRIVLGSRAAAALYRFERWTRRLAQAAPLRDRM